LVTALLFPKFIHASVSGSDTPRKLDPGIYYTDKASCLFIAPCKYPLPTPTDFRPYTLRDRKRIDKLFPTSKRLVLSVLHVTGVESMWFDNDSFTVDLKPKYRWGPRMARRIIEASKRSVIDAHALLSQVDSQNWRNPVPLHVLQSLDRLSGNTTVGLASYLSSGNIVFEDSYVTVGPDGKEQIIRRGITLIPIHPLDPLMEKANSGDYQLSGDTLAPSRGTGKKELEQIKLELQRREDKRIRKERAELRKQGKWR